MAEFDFEVAKPAKGSRFAKDSEGRGGPRYNETPPSLLQTMGNRSVARMLQREAAPEEEEVQAKHDPATVSREDDEEIQALHEQGALAQRAPEVGLAGGAVSDNLAGRIDSMRGGGSALDDSTRTSMEGALGTSLGGVRVHVGSESDELNQSITAKAFTTGNDVFVRSDQWAPGSSSTQRLMAHELTHVAQQQSGVGGGGSGMTVGSSDAAEEHEADAVADAVVSRSQAEPEIED